MSPKSKIKSPLRDYAIVALLLSLGGAVALYAGLSWDPLVSWLVPVNAVAFVFYGFDKMRAKSGGLRVPEKLLHGLVLVGGAVGGLVGMRLFHHKTRKASFRRVFWAIVALEVAAVCAWLVLT